MAAAKASNLFMMLGRCMTPDVKNAVKISVKRLELDKNLNMYFPAFETYYANDPNNQCKPGDVVLIKQLPQKLTKEITHEVKEIVFPLGDITDPVTGKKVVVGRYRDNVNWRNEMYGKNPEGFDYSKAPQRGSQKEKRDFTYQETYKKYHVFENDDQPYAV
nr:EOG090X0GMQ [Eulimnadia texana]